MTALSAWRRWWWDRSDDPNGAWVGIAGDVAEVPVWVGSSADACHERSPMALRPRAAPVPPLRPPVRLRYGRVRARRGFGQLSLEARLA